MKAVKYLFSLLALVLVCIGAVLAILVQIAGWLCRKPTDRLVPIVAILVGGGFLCWFLPALVKATTAGQIAYNVTGAFFALVALAVGMLCLLLEIIESGCEAGKPDYTIDKNKGE